MQKKYSLKILNSILLKKKTALVKSIFGRQKIKHTLKEIICKSHDSCAKVPRLKDAQTAGETPLGLVFL